jgi:hypothetical protein
MTRDKKSTGRGRRRRTTRRRRARHTLERNGILTALHPTSTMKDWLPQPSTNLRSSQKNAILALWLRRRYAFEIPPSSDEESSDDEVDYTDLFKGLDRAKVDKINELIDALNEKDRLLEKQEDILYEEHDKFFSVQKSLALEIKRNEMLSSELSTCHESVSSLKDLNDELNAKVEEANAIRSCVEHVVVCNRCKDFGVNACDEHLASIAKLNNEVVSLNAQLKTCKMDYDKPKFARDAYTVGRHPSIKDDLGFRKETKNLTS